LIDLYWEIESVLRGAQYLALGIESHATIAFLSKAKVVPLWVLSSCFYSTKALDFMQLWRNVHRISGRNRSEIPT